ncbi:Esterase E4 [Blattella germanica]|nr:Esterase E4 [Blattella germanica]
MSGITIVLLLLSTVNLCLCQLETVTVTIAQGELRGQAATTINGLKYYSFQGIPYAKPPVGSLRFRSPQPPDPWDGVRDALEEGAMCSQMMFQYSGEEDCLFINVATPALPENGSTELKPVMVNIHGGAFLGGSGSFSMSGPEFLLEEDVVFASMNYRLGALGFFSTGDSVASGNNGLKDQVMALRWIQQNIAAFGGDPNRVTIFGISAGGCSVSHLVLSPAAAGCLWTVQLSLTNSIKNQFDSFITWFMFKNTADQ